MDSNSRVPIYSQDAIEAGVPDKEIKELEQHFSHLDPTEVHKIYLTPSVCWSDFCEHGSVNKLHRSAKCQVNGVAYALSPNARLSKIVNSTDMYGAVSVYKITSFGKDLDRMVQ